MDSPHAEVSPVGVARSEAHNRCGFRHVAQRREACFLVNKSSLTLDVELFPFEQRAPDSMISHCKDAARTFVLFVAVPGAVCLIHLDAGPTGATHEVGKLRCGSNEVDQISLKARCPTAEDPRHMA